LILREDGTPYLAAGAAAGLSQVSFLDLTNPEAREFAKSHMHRVIGQGADGWMADYAEWTPIDGVQLFDGSDPAETHNRFPQLWQELNAEVVEEADLTGQMGIYFRSGHRSAPRTAGLVWAGDQRTSFAADDGLPTVIPMGLGLAAAGVPFYGHDIAGYQFIGNDPGTKELFFRWTSLGALSPLMRTHHGIKVDENWDLRDDEESTAHWKRYAELHVQLYPYIRGLAAAAVNDGEPLWIPMGLVHPDDDTAWPITDQYYFGPALLVAPVVTKSETEDGAVTRSIYFPDGRFSSFMGPADAVTGPSHVSVDVPLTEIPIYIKAGGIVPMTAEPAQTLRIAEGMRDLTSTEGHRIVYVGLGSDGTFEEEDGATYSLSGTGVTPQTVDIIGNDTVSGDGWTFTLSGHPADRQFTIFAQ
jgi:alpha-glucosidase